MNRAPCSGDTLVLTRACVARLAQPPDYIRAVEAAFRALAAGEIDSLPVGHVPGHGGTFHIKSAVSTGDGGHAAIKINGNFPGNSAEAGLPTIQGCIVLADRSNGRVLALMDSIEITAQRTAAASALAARHLARRDSRTIAFIGCGTQARYHLDALLALDRFPIEEARCFDLDATGADAMRLRCSQRGLAASVATTAADACRDADIVIACTTSRAPVIGASDIKPGAFIAAVGADSPSKCEMAPELLARSRVVTDITDQAALMGDLRTALESGLMKLEDVHGELAQIVCATRPARERDADVFLFDSTGTAIEDLAAAVMIFERARANPGVLRVALNASPPIWNVTPRVEASPFHAR